MAKSKFLINKQAVQDFIFQQLKERRPYIGLTRISSSVYTQLDELVRRQIVRWVDQHPTKGKTFKP